MQRPRQRLYLSIRVAKSLPRAQGLRGVKNWAHFCSQECVIWPCAPARQAIDPSFFSSCQVGAQLVLWWAWGGWERQALVWAPSGMNTSLGNECPPITHKGFLSAHPVPSSREAFSVLVLQEHGVFFPMGDQGTCQA